MKLRAQGYSNQTMEFLFQAWKKNTHSRYDSGWKIFTEWCDTNRVNPIAATTPEICDFLVTKFSDPRKLQTGTIEGYLSSLRSVLNFEEGGKSALEPILSKLLTAFNHIRPKQARYDDTFDVRMVLDHMAGIPEPWDLKTLSSITAAMLIISGICRASDIARIHGTLMKVTNDRIWAPVVDTLKQQRRGEAIAIDIHITPTNHVLNPVNLVRRYLVDSQRRRPNDCDYLFVTIGSTRRNAKAPTIAKWIRKIMLAAGVEEKFKGHALRMACVAAALGNGIPVMTIMKIGRWRSYNTFEKFYARPQDRAAHADKLLAPRAAPAPAEP